MRVISKRWQWANAIILNTCAVGIIVCAIGIIFAAWADPRIPWWAAIGLTLMAVFLLLMALWLFAVVSYDKDRAKASRGEQ